MSKRKQEHEAMLLKRTKAAGKLSDKPVSKPEAPVDSITQDEKSNGECKESEETFDCEPCHISEKVEENLQVKGRGALQPPRVLEVSD